MSGVVWPAASAFLTFSSLWWIARTRSTTGHGEAFIRTVLAKTALDILRDLDDPEPACHVALDVVREDGRGDGGLILLDWRGRLGWAHSTPFMPVGWCVPTATEPVLPF